MSQTVLVTGATGLAGANICTHSSDPPRRSRHSRAKRDSQDA